MEILRYIGLKYRKNKAFCPTFRPIMERNSAFNTRVFLLIFALILVINVWFFRPLGHSFAFGAIIAGIFYPLFFKIRTQFKGQSEWAGLATCLLILLFIALPFVYLSVQISREAVGLYSQIKSALDAGEVHNFFFGDGLAAVLVERGLELFNSDLSKQDIYSLILHKAQDYSGLIFETLNGQLRNIFNFLFYFSMMMVTIYGLLTEGEALKQWFFRLSPLPDDEEQIVFEKFKQMNFVSLVCNGLGGIIQGVLAGLGFWLAGINSLFLWSSCMVILAFIPLVGISVIFVPACVYLYLTGSPVTAAILFVYCALVAFVVENWFKPRFIGGRVQVSGVLLLFYIVGGMLTFGMAGIFYGPLLCVVLLTVVELFQKNYLPRLQ